MSDWHRSTLVGVCAAFFLTFPAPKSASEERSNGSTDQAPSHVTFMVGDGTVDGSILKPYDNVWLYSVTNESGKVIPQGLWSDHLQMTTSNGKATLLRVQGMTYVNGATTSTLNVFDPKTLEPFSSRQQGTKGEIVSRVFTGRHVSITRTSKDGTSTAPTEIELPAVPFDFNGGMYGLFLATVPFKKGRQEIFYSMEEFEDKIAIDSYKVIGQETVDAGMRGKIDAWRIESERPGKYRMIFWVTKFPPYVIKLNYTVSNSSLVWNWTMI
jgi:hypothetical protein